MTRQVKKYSASLFLLLFLWYFASINLFSHNHLINGNSIVHSHFGGTDSHEHSDDQFVVIDILSDFQSDSDEQSYFSYTLFFLSADISYEDRNLKFKDCISASISLRGPPQC